MPNTYINYKSIRICSACKEELPNTEEYFVRNGKYLKSTCKECGKKYQREHYKKNKEEKNRKAREWYQKNREVHLANTNQWARDNAKSKQLHSSNRRARIRGAIGEIDSDSISELWFEQNGYCEYCNTDLIITGYTIDHIIPLTHGGTNLKDNLCLACKPCNSAKGSISYSVFKARFNA